MANKDFSRPILITILAAITILIFVLVLIFGGVSLAMTDTVAEQFVKQNPGVTLDAAKTMVFALGIFALIIGIVGTLIGYGLITGRTWAWYLAVISYAISLLFFIVSMVMAGKIGIGAMVFVVINVVILYYLFRPGVKGWFNV
jgi:uncharacterized membrane protein (DUF2068 family)